MLLQTLEVIYAGLIVDNANYLSCIVQNALIFFRNSVSVIK